MSQGVPGGPRPVGQLPAPAPAPGNVGHQPVAYSPAYFTQQQQQQQQQPAAYSQQYLQQASQQQQQQYQQIYQQQQAAAAAAAAGQQARSTGAAAQPAGLANLRGYSASPGVQLPQPTQQQLQQALAQHPQLQAQLAQALPQAGFQGMQAAQQMRPAGVYAHPMRPTAPANAAKMVRPPPPATGQAQPQGAVRAAEVAPAIRRQPTSTAAQLAAKQNNKRKLPEPQSATQRLAARIPKSTLYNAGMSLEAELDTHIAGRRAQLADALHNPPRVPKRLRVYTYNRHYHQPPNTSDADPPSWELLIYGKVVDAHETAAGGAAIPAAMPRLPTQPFTHYLRSLEVRRLDTGGAASAGAAGPAAGALAAVTPSLYSWRKADHEGRHKEQISIKHMGSADVPVQITLEVDRDAEQFVVEEPLASFIGKRLESRTRILDAIWHYIKRHQLQNPAQPERINCDERMQGVFQSRNLTMNSVLQRLTPFLKPVPPVTWTYTVKVSGPSPGVQYVHDIEIDIPATAHDGRVAPFIDKLSNILGMDQLDAKLAALVRRVNEHDRRHQLLRGFSTSPADFINALVARQAAELRAVREEGRNELALVRRTDLFQGKWVEDAVLRYLHHRLAAGA